jgi:hypothetical protein
MHPALRRAGIVVCLLGLLGILPGVLRGLEPARPATTTFAAAIERLSEPEGAFDTDNLVSNEKSYLDVIPALVAGHVSGGAYIGVGPDQNFSYIARVRPTFAYIIDVRRDNLLLHLLFKALFAQARNRAEYLSLLTGRPLPDGLERWSSATLEEIVAHVDRSTPTPGASRALRGHIDQTIEGFGVPLVRADLETIGRFHQTFITAGLDLQFQSHGRRPNDSYPTFRELLLARDVNGRKWNYLASEDDFQFVKSLEGRDAIIPVVGNVSGPHALRAIGAAIAERRERVSAFYISNVEFYLTREGAFGRFVDNLSRLPRDGRSVMIRSMFGRGSSVSVVQSIDRTIAEAPRGPR